MNLEPEHRLPEAVGRQAQTLDILQQLFAAVDSIALQRNSSGSFTAITTLPPWLNRIFPELHSNNDEFELHGAMPFLDFFIEDAEQHWADQTAGVLDSDEWVEVDLKGEDLPLKAAAHSFGDTKILLITSLEKSYWQQQKVYQHARDTMLTRDHLEIEVRQRTEQIRRREEEISIRLLAASSTRDKETGAHVRRIGLYAAAMATALGWSQNDIDDIRIGGSMHDLGKIGIPDSILLKPGRLDAEEFELMQQHARIGANMLAGTEIPLLEIAHDIALYHHERWDGKGYPEGLAGAEIPLAARIVAICDVYDALCSKRVYKEEFSENQTLEIMQEESGKHFDPALFDVFKTVLPQFAAIKQQVKENKEPEIAIQPPQATGTDGR